VQAFSGKNLNEREHLKDPDVEGGNIELPLKKQDRRLGLD
jgi:hypothetical protein